MESKSLLQYFGITVKEKVISKDVRGLIAKAVIGNGGWWYPSASSSRKRYADFHPRAYGPDRLWVHPKDETILLIDGSGTGEKRNKIEWWVRGYCEEILTLKNQEYHWSAGFHLKKDMVATISYKEALLWNRMGKKCAILAHKKRVYSVAFHPQKDMVATASEDGTAALWNDNGEKIATLRHQDAVYSVDFHPHKDIVATASEDGTAAFWDYDGNKLMEFFSGLEGAWRVKFLMGRSGGISIRLFSGSHVRSFHNLDNKQIYNFSEDPAHRFSSSAKFNKKFVWREHKPTLKQVLLRQVLKNYVIECITRNVKPKIVATEKGLLPWMAKKFELDQTELEDVWQSYPPMLQLGILKTVSKYAVKECAVKETEQHGILDCTIC